MAKASDTGDPAEYDTADEAAIEAAVDAAWAEYESTAAGTPSVMRVAAQIEWSGVLDRARNGHRTTRLDSLNLTRVEKALDRAREANRRLAAARPASSYQAKGWAAQLRALTESKRGSAAADTAGLDPSARTLRRWLVGDVTPTRANQARIADAYGALRTWRRDTAAANATRANHVFAEEMSSALRRRYGAEIRLRNITDMRFE
ncbi:MAG: hypothetical protein ACRDRK_08785 [Pseudonocardia sp.]